MKAVILCGGTGSRLRPLTELTPKPLIRLLNVPVLDHIIQKVIGAGISDIWLSLGYKSQDIISFCEQKHYSAQIHYCTEEKPLGTAGGVKNCIKQCDDLILVLSGDNIFNVDLSKAAAFHKASGADITLIGKDAEDPREYGVIIKEADGRISSFLEKPTWENAESFLVNTGIYILNGDVLNMIPEDTAYDFADQLFPKALQDHKRLMCYHTSDFWGDIGEFNAYLSYNAELLRSHTDDFVYNGVLYVEDTEDDKGNVIFAPTLVGKNLRIGTGNRIGPFTVIGNNCKIGDNCNIENSVLGDDTQIGDRSDLTACITDDNVRIGTNCSIEENTVLGYGVLIGNFARLLKNVKIWPGKQISAESVISNDMFFESPEKIEPDVYGISGKAFSQFTLNDAVRLGQAIASAADIKRIGIGCDGSKTAAVYGDVLSSGLRSCGGISYDFEVIFKAQAYFYAAYCSLDVFIYISCDDETVNFAFFGKNGSPVSVKTARQINSNFRFSTFRYAQEEGLSDGFRMHLLSVAYRAFLKNSVSASLSGMKVHVECENNDILLIMNEVLDQMGAKDDPNGIQFLINENGTDMYCLYQDRFYSSDRLKAILSELAFAEGRKVIAGEEAPDFLAEKAASYGVGFTVLRESENAFDTQTFFESLWNFDAVSLCFKLLGVLSQTGLALNELCDLQGDFVIRKRIVDLNCPPQRVRTLIESTGAKKNTESNSFYALNTAKGGVRLRQLGNSSRIKILSQAVDMETAKELAGSVYGKIMQGIIDNKIK